jgi:tetratricopeptide (TPR) repeat protein
VKISFRFAILMAGLSTVAFAAFAKLPLDVYRQAAASSAVVKTFNAQGKSLGMASGVVITGGDVVTNCHVIKGANRFRVRVAEKEFPATLQFTDWERDLCLFSTAGVKAPPAVLGNSNLLRVGAKVYAVGAPKGLAFAMSDGTISSLRDIKGGQFIQTTAAVSVATSGGGLFDDNGELIGIATYIPIETKNIYFAIPVEWLKDLAQRSTKVPPSEFPVTQWLSKVVELEARKDFKGLIEHGDRWTKSQPGSELAWYGLGTAYDTAGQRGNAIDAYQQAVRINPEYAVAWYKQGVDFDNTGQPAKAMESYQQALKANPQHALAWNSLGNSYDNMGQHAKAIDACQQALKFKPDYPGAWYNLGNAYENSGQRDKAIAAYQQALRMNSEFSDASNNLGIAYRRAGQYDQAIAAYQQAIRTNPRYAEAWNNLGIAYESSGQRDKAIEAYQQALKINPDYAGASNNLGIAYRNAGLNDKAIEAYQQAVRINPEYGVAWNNLGSTYEEVGQSAKATQAYQQAKRTNQ